MTVLAWLIYIPLQAIWMPCSILGALWVAYKQIWRSKTLGLSQTAVEIINGRWTAHVFGLREDIASYKLASELPNNSILGLRLVLFPLMIARIIAGKPIIYPQLPSDDQSNIANMVFSRSVRFDSLIAASIKVSSQLVILGAGLDTRAYGPLAKANLSIFELDKDATQRAKQEALKSAKLESDHVHYVSVDFTNPDWVRALLASPYDPDLKTTFVWEGVTLYLSEAEVLAILGTIKSNCASGSVVVADFYGQRILKMASKGAMATSLEATGETMDFGFDLSADPQSKLSTFASSVGCDLTAHYFLGSAHKDGPYMVIAVMEV